MRTIEERKREGKAFRKTISRKDFGKWEVQTNRPVVEQLILEQERTRREELIPIRRERMAVSPFSFFRGSAVIQAYDISTMPWTGFRVQACGDAHICNFGIFASPERRMIFDINDFDETLPAPFDVDIKRLLASIEICGRQRGFSKKQCATAVYDTAAYYRQTIRELSDKGNMEVWYEHLDMERFMTEKADILTSDQMKYIEGAVKKATSKTNEKALRKFTETVDGKLRIKSNPPLVVPLRDMVSEEENLFGFHYSIEKALQIYQESLPTERRNLISLYKPIELAHKVVGVGSIGRAAWILVLLGRENGDPLVLQIKEAEKSVLEAYFGRSTYDKCGRRVVEGQRAIQNCGDILLGWARLTMEDGRQPDYYVRQLWDAKGSFDIESLPWDGYRGLSLMCAWTLAHSHAKTGDRHTIAGYLGNGEAFEEAMVRYADAYADQNEADYEMFLKRFRPV